MHVFVVTHTQEKEVLATGIANSVHLYPNLKKVQVNIRNINVRKHLSGRFPIIGPETVLRAQSLWRQFAARQRSTEKNKKLHTNEACLLYAMWCSNIGMTLSDYVEWEWTETNLQWVVKNQVPQKGELKACRASDAFGQGVKKLVAHVKKFLPVVSDSKGDISNLPFLDLVRDNCLRLLTRHAFPKHLDAALTLANIYLRMCAFFVAFK